MMKIGQGSHTLQAAEGTSQRCLSHPTLDWIEAG